MDNFQPHHKVLRLLIFLGAACLQRSSMAAPKAPRAWTLGDKKLLFVRVDFEDIPGEPISVAEVQDVMNQVSAFYTANSGGKIRIMPDVTPVLRLPHPASWYVTQGGLKQGIPRDARSAARNSGYDLDLYQLEVVFCAKIDAKPIGSGLLKRKGMIISGSGRFGTIAHELGHNFGLYHANLWKTDDGSIIGAGKSKEYGDPFDLMGPGAPTNEERALRHLSAWSKNYLNWLPDESIQDVAASGTYRIFAHDMPGANGLRALKIKKDGQRNYWIEFRQLQKSNFSLMNGALIYWGFDDVTPTTKGLLLDMTPKSSAGAKDAPLLIGRTFSDLEAGIHITPVAKGGTTPESLDVVVNIGPFPDNAAPRVKVTSDSLRAKPGQLVTLKADANDADGDPLAYGWECSDGTAGGNRAVVTRSWTRRGSYQIRCTVTDMKGGIGSDVVQVVVR